MIDWEAEAHLVDAAFKVKLFTIPGEADKTIAIVGPESNLLQYEQALVVLAQKNGVTLSRSIEGDLLIGDRVYLRYHDTYDALVEWSVLFDPAGENTLSLQHTPKVQPIPNPPQENGAP